MFRMIRFGFMVFFFCSAVVLIAVLLVIWNTHASLYTYSTVPKKQVALVLGASVSSDGKLSPVLKERADGAVQLYLDRKVTKILVSGDNSSLAHNEVYPVGKYLVSRGVPITDIFLDYAGFDTYSSMYRAKNVFTVESMIITSQRFHLPRALFVARTLGIDAVGVDVSLARDQYLQNALREIPATAKALFDIVIHRIPLYLGQNYTVKGDGSATWVGSTTEMVYFLHD